MNESKLPRFDSIDELVEFFDTHDMGDYDLPEVDFDVELKKRTFLIAVDEKLMRKLAEVAKAQHTSTEKLIKSWLEEKATQAV